MSNVPTIEIAIALVWRDRRLLVTRRREGAHLGGLWEFPGGKIRAGESAERAAERELFEETGVLGRAREARAVSEHAYPDRVVRLHPVDCDWVSGEAKAIEVAECVWLAPFELQKLEFPAANAGLVRELAREGR